MEPLVSSIRQDNIRILEVENRFFGGNIKVTGLMVGEDINRVLSSEPHGDRYLIPDVCLNNGKFLDGLEVGELCRNVEVVPTDGASLRAAISKRESSNSLPQGIRL